MSSNKCCLCAVRTSKASVKHKRLNGKKQQHYSSFYQKLKFGFEAEQKLFRFIRNIKLFPVCQLY